MSLEEIKAELSEMPKEQQDHLAAFLIHLRHQRDAAIREEITSRNGDKDPSHWIPLGELKEKWKD